MKVNSKLKSTKNNKMNKTHFLNLVLKHLKDVGTEEEYFSMMNYVKVLFNKGAQQVLDFVKNEFENKHPELLEEWLDLVEFTSSHSYLDGPNGKSIEAVLFLIPVIMSLDTTMQSADMENQHDDFEIGRLGVVRDLMVKTGLISNNEENVSMLTRLFSLDEVLAFTDVEKYKLLEMFIFEKGNHTILKHEMFKATELTPNVVHTRLRFIIGCAMLKDMGKNSLLDEWMTPSDSNDDSYFERAAKAIEQFSEKLSDELPTILKEKKATKVTTIITSIEEFTTYGVKAGIKNFDDFHLSLLLEQAMVLNNPKITLSVMKENLAMELLEGNKKIFDIKLHDIYDSVEEFDDYMGELFYHLEFCEFYCNSLTEKAAIFIRKKLKFNSAFPKNGIPGRVLN